MRFIGLTILSVFALAISVCSEPNATQPEGASTPLGGIGTGYVEILLNGRFGDITINNNRHQPIPSPAGCFAAVYAEGKGKGLYAEGAGPRGVKEVRFRGMYPEANLDFVDSDLPVAVSLHAFTPLVLGDAEQSTLPAAVFQYRVKNPSGKPVKVSLAFSWGNLIGIGGGESGVALSGTCAQTPFNEGALRGFRYTFDSGSVDGAARNALGEYVAAIQSEKGDSLSFLSNWRPDEANTEFWNGFGRGAFGEGSPGNGKSPAEGAKRPAAAVAATRTVPAGGETVFTFLLTWYMPNQYGSEGQNSGVYYRNQWKSAAHVATYTADRWPAIAEQIKAVAASHLNPSLPAGFHPRLINGAAVLAKSSVYLENGQFALFSAEGDHPGLLGSPEERLPMLHFFLRWYPQLLKSELQLFARAQIPSGEIPSGAGNLYTRVGTGDVPGGFEGRPDSTAAFLLLAYDYALWTGDTDFLSGIASNLNKALLWLMTIDTNQDSIPNGPSLWPPVEAGHTSLFTADLFTAALRVGEEIVPDLEMQSQSRRAREEVINNLSSQLWNGHFFDLFFNPAQPTSGAEYPLFAGTLPGEWFAVSEGLNPFVDPFRMLRAGQSAAEAAAAGTLYSTWKDMGSGFYQKVYPAYVQAFTGSLLARQGLLDACFRLVEQNEPRSWNDTDASLWTVYDALTGATVDMKRQCLTVGPVLPSGVRNISLPLRTPIYRGWMNYRRATETALEQCEITLEETASGRDTALKQVAYLLPIMMDANAVTLRVLKNGEFLPGQDITRERLRVFDFNKPVPLKRGDRLTLILSPQNSGKIRFDLSQFKVNNQGAQCSIQTTTKNAPNYTLVVTNLLPQQQIVNLEFHKKAQETFSVYLNGDKLPELTGEANVVPILLQTSPIGVEDYQWLHLTHQGCEEAIVRIAPLTGRKDLYNQLWALQEAVNRAINLDTFYRGIQIDVIASNFSGAPRKPERETDPRRLQDELAKTKELAARFRQTLARTAQDPVLAAQILGDFTPLTLRAVLGNTGEEGQPFEVEAAVSNPHLIPHESRLSLEAPDTWKVEAVSPVALNELKEQKLMETVKFRVTPAGNLHDQRFPLRAVLAGSWEGNPFRKELTVVAGHTLIREWLVIGPFSNQNGEGFNVQYMPQQNVKPKETYEGMDGQKVSWQKMTFDNGYVDFDAKMTPNDNAVGYAYLGVYSSREQPVRLVFGTNGDIKIFNNYKEIYSRRSVRKPEPGGEAVRTQLFAGWNHIIVKVCERTGPWGFYFEITDLSGMPIIDLQYSLDKAE